MGAQYLPLNNKWTLKFTKDGTRRIFTASEMECGAAANQGTGNASHFHIANCHDNTNAAYTAHITNGGQSATNLGNLDEVKTELTQFEIHYKKI